ncbi:HAD hydrolase-like protein [Amnibacterium kyonggiense]|uniref:Phosphoglycolate phosphatase n=1 Tax=Amnibacterium kyonggiense TaxID=595671 RepID=A0A4R7FPW3_9MICO|nr:HAD hydrolase-like protein [Amnibacterium kyonggiense]TDS79800.1 phosphoglycolate phosphatase [Amnibacterium kyonggiense]
MSEPFTVILVDLDGTVMDSALGITRSLAVALEELGLPVPPPARMVEFVGPPILDGLRDVAGLEPADAARTLERYRERYRRLGAFEAEPYAGIREALERLRELAPLAIATSKPEGIATRILEHFAFAPLFTVIAGASDDETRSTKADVITRALELLVERGVDVSRPVMIGDRIHDVEGAAAHGIPTVVAGWGYGAPEEAAGAVAIADAPADLPAIVAAGAPEPV